MDLRQLTTLVAIADHRSFSSAAKALFTVQSNVSAHVAKLEHELDAVLYDRTRSQLTEAGQVVVARARRVLAELDALRADLSSLGTEVAGDARIGLIPTTARWLLPQLLTRLRADHPRIRLVVTSATTASLRPQLASGALDAALLALPTDDPELAAQPLFEEDLVLAVPLPDALARRDRVGLAELAGRELLLEAPGTPLRDGLDRAAAAVGVRLKPAAEVDGARLLAALAADGHGLAIVPRTALPPSVCSVARVAIDQLPPRVVGVARNRRALLSPPSRAVLEIIEQLVQASGPAMGIRPLAPAPAGP